MKHRIVYFFSFLVLFSCNQTIKTSDTKFDQDKQTQLSNFAKALFCKDKINFKETLDSIKIFSDIIQIDTAKYVRRPKANLYITTIAKAHFQIFENPKGTITAMTFYKNGKKIYVAEYFKNGQIICKFLVTDNGVRNGKYTCYNEDGFSIMTSYYKNNNIISDSTKYFENK